MIVHTMRRLPKNLLLVWVFALLIIVALHPAPLFAQSATQELTATPAVIDESNAKAQGILTESITIQNTSDQTLELYPSVNDVQDQSGEQPFAPAQNAPEASASLSNWIELSRGVIELGPGQQQTVPFVIRIPTDAVAGSYHALISFANGDTRDDANARGALASVTVNVDLQADIVNLMQLNSFSTDNLVFSGDDVLFTYQLQNVGNQSLDPKGEISIYDRKGEEVATIDINSEGKVISPDQVSQLASTWSAASGFGKYKAVINVDYGTSQVASVQDVTYFWIIPWQQVLGLSVVTLLALIFFSLYFHRWLENQHFGKLAAAGLINEEALAKLQEPPPPPPAAPEEPQIPKEPLSVRAKRMAERVHTTIEEKGQQYSDFRRTGFISPKSPKAASPQSAAPAQDPAPQSAPAQSAPGTINLKQALKPEPSAAPQPHHVINLKDK